MNRRETVYRNMQPIGAIIQDDFTGQIAFFPADGIRRLPFKDWQSVDELKAALRQLYGIYGRPEGRDMP